MASNLAVLTKSHKIVAAKKRQRKEQIKEIVFDDTARLEYLTGFHKRNLQKREAGKKKAQEREKRERLDARKEHRRMLAEQAKENAAKVEEAYGGLVAGASDEEDDDEWTGFSAGEKGKGRADEYEDEEQVATVTVVEDFDPDTLIHGDAPARPDPAEGDDELKPKAYQGRSRSADAKESGEARVRKAKVKPKKIKYQTAAARKAETSKQRARRTEKAERAGGKAARRKGKRR
ncbi:hypothetical protein DENSPDRAFT_530278 [Dentipellis sp. KUC8613]|nr:hypothetical protein DENSPDRAFT_530278 [Dentipellis sp. KUC8613]